MTDERIESEDVVPGSDPPEQPTLEVVSAKQDAFEKRQDYFARELRRIGDHVADLSGATMRIEATVQGTAVHVRRMAQEKDITAEELARQDKEMRLMRNYISSREAERALERVARKSQPEQPYRAELPSYSDLSPTQKTQALTEKDVELVMAKQRIKELEDDRSVKREESNWKRRTAVVAIISLSTAVTSGYLVYRLTRPATTLTVETQKK